MVTAEGIENEIILETLKRMGKMKGQGYHYGRPEPAADVLRRLEEQDLLAKDLPANVTEIDFGKRQPGREGGTEAQAGCSQKRSHRGACVDVKVDGAPPSTRRRPRYSVCSMAKRCHATDATFSHQLDCKTA